MPSLLFQAFLKLIYDITLYFSTRTWTRFIGVMAIWNGFYCTLPEYPLDVPSFDLNLVWFHPTIPIISLNPGIFIQTSFFTILVGCLWFLVVVWLTKAKFKKHGYAVEAKELKLQGYKGDLLVVKDSVVGDSPVCVGHTIYVPEDLYFFKGKFTGFTASMFEGVVMHENGHVKNNDTYVPMAMQSISILLFGLPWHFANFTTDSFDLMISYSMYSPYIFGVLFFWLTERAVNHAVEYRADRQIPVFYKAGFAEFLMLGIKNKIYGAGISRSHPPVNKRIARILRDLKPKA